MLLFSIPSFREDLRKLSSTGKSEYVNCVTDVDLELKRFKNIDELFNSARTLAGNGQPKRTLKVRIANSKQNGGKSSGYRLICYGNNQTNTLYLLIIYPKLGRFGKTNVTPEEISAAVKELKSCADNKTGFESFPPNDKLQVDGVENQEVLSQTDQDNRRGLN